MSQCVCSSDISNFERWKRKIITKWKCCEDLWTEIHISFECQSEKSGWKSNNWRNNWFPTNNKEETNKNTRRNSLKWIIKLYCYVKLRIIMEMKNITNRSLPYQFDISMKKWNKTKAPKQRKSFKKWTLTKSHIYM